MLLLVPWQSFPFAKERTQFCRWMCTLCLGNSRNHCDPLERLCTQKYRLDVFSEMKKGRRSSAVCNPEDQTEMSSGEAWFYWLRIWPNLDFLWQKIERLKAELHLLDAAGSSARRHLFFVDTEREGETWARSVRKETHFYLSGIKIQVL